MPSSSLPSSFPAAPTNGTPCLSSWKPGASPTNIRSAVGEPEPKTTWVRPFASAHFVQTATSTTATSSADASTEAGLDAAAVRCEDRELLLHLRLAAFRASRGLVVTD